MTDKVFAQYDDAKAAYPGMVLLFRVGDFYEAFGEDVAIVAKAIGLTITSRQGRPMCGFPHQQLANYLSKLLPVCRVAICEYDAEAKAANS